MRHSFAAPPATSFAAMPDFPYSDHPNFSDFDGAVVDHQDYYFSYSELLNDLMIPIPMDSSSSPDHSSAVAGKFGGAVTLSRGESTSGSGPGFPATPSGSANPPHDFPSSLLMQSSSCVSYQQYPSSSSIEPYYNQSASTHQLLPKFEPSPDNNALLAISERRKSQTPVLMDKPANDGYKWKKYGQKPIKGHTYLRGYYKCTHPDCPVTKKVQHCNNGHITQIIYSGGDHIHEPPQLGRRANGYNHTPVPTDSEDSTDAYMRFDEDDGVAEGSNGGATSETMTGPKFVVQTRSEIEVLDDGYRWRKYGQKVVKGNSNPRSYYKCTSNGCCVRKQVERSSKDPGAVITTYVGKHDHEVPATLQGRHSSSHSD